VHTDDTVTTFPNYIHLKILYILSITHWPYYLLLIWAFPLNDCLAAYSCEGGGGGGDDFVILVVPLFLLLLLIINLGFRYVSSI
jgi:hypothetical protein